MRGARRPERKAKRSQRCLKARPQQITGTLTRLQCRSSAPIHERGQVPGFLLPEQALKRAGESADPLGARSSSLQRGRYHLDSKSELGQSFFQALELRGVLEGDQAPVREPRFCSLHVSSHGADWTSVQGGGASFEAQLLDDFLPESFTNFLGSVAREDRLVVLVANLEVTAIG